MGIRLDKPWSRWDAIEPADLPGQLGVFQVADADGTVVYIGYAGGRELFGLRSAVPAAVEALAAADIGPPVLVRYELTHGYLTRWEELLMLHLHDAGTPPAGNDPLETPPGRLSPGQV